MWKRSLFTAAICASFYLGVYGAQRLLAIGPFGYYCVGGTGDTCPVYQCSYRFGTCTTCGPRGAGGAPCTASKCSHCEPGALCCRHPNSCDGLDLNNNIQCSCDTSDAPPNGTVNFCQRQPSTWSLFASR